MIIINKKEDKEEIKSEIRLILLIYNQKSRNWNQLQKGKRLNQMGTRMKP